MADLFVSQKITDTLRENYMPYIISVMMSRAIPEIDGFKPSHRKLLYTMYKMGLLTGQKTKSANIVGQTMRLNPHGDSAIYDTLVRLSRGHEALLYPFIDSKGSFGKHYSRDMAYAAARYTECKLDSFCNELFCDIDKDTVDLIDNYDGTMKEPVLFPTTFPNVLVNANMGIAVGMASNICSFNLTEVCKTTIALMLDPNHDISQTLLAPDFSTGGQIILSHEEMRKIYETGRGSFKIRAKYVYDAKKQTIDVAEIPYTTTVEAIMDKIAELMKAGRLKEVSDAKDLTDKDGLKLTIELKKGTDATTLINKLYKLTPLEDAFPCNFNILVGGMPRVMGVREILDEWIAFRTECLRRSLCFDMAHKRERLHLLDGLAKILLDIDRAIAIIRGTAQDSMVIPNLMKGFDIDEIQATFVADIRLRNLNKEYLLNKVAEREQLNADIEDIEKTLESRGRMKKVISNELLVVSKKYGKPRRSEIVFEGDIEEYVEVDNIEDYPVSVFVTRDGYLKKITPLSLRMGGEQRLKEGDEIVACYETTNKAELIVFTDRACAYKGKVYDFADAKASVMGDYLPNALGFEPGESVIFAAITTDYSEQLVIFYENGRGNKTDLKSFATKTNRKKLLNAYCDKFKPIAMFLDVQDRDYLLTASNGKALIVNSQLIPYKASRSSQGVIAMSQGKKGGLISAERYEKGRLDKAHLYTAKSLPSSGKAIGENDTKFRLI